MGDPHTRSMDGGWNPGEVWPVPVECLLNGMSTDAHLMFGGGPVFSPHFRHRFQTPVHLSPTHLAPLPGSINVNVSIPLTQHTLVDTGQVGGAGNPAVGVQDNNGQDPHALSQPLSMDNGDDVLEESEDASEEDDEDDVDDGVPGTLGHGHDQQHPHSNTIPLGHDHGMENNTLVQCQQQVVRNTLQQAPLMSMDEPHIQQCIIQKPNDTVRHNHAGHNQSVDSMIMSMEDDFTSQNNSSDSDPNSGFSVHGKMYFEGRVVLHLKQWTDTPGSDGSSLGMGNGGSGFSSCAEQQHQKGLHGCAVCRLKSPHENHRNQKEAHRHTVKGVLFTFEDCIIVELYPEQQSNNAPVDPKPQPPPPPPVTEAQQPKDHPMPIESYMNSAVTMPSPQEQAKKFIHHMEVPCIGSAVQPNSPPQRPVTMSHPQTTDDWWDEFESNDDELKRGEESIEDDNSPPDSVNSPCISTLKLPSQVLNDEDACDYKLKSKSPVCSSSFLNTPQIETHSCSDPGVVTPMDSVELSSDPHSAHANSIASDSLTTLQSSEESQHSITPSSTHTDEQALSITEVKTTTPSHSCPSCTKSFHVKCLLKQHLEESHSDGNPWRCMTCNQQFMDDKRPKKHACIRSKIAKRQTSSKAAKKKSNNLKSQLSIRRYSAGIINKVSSEDDVDSEKSESELIGSAIELQDNRDLSILPDDSSSNSPEMNDIEQDNSGEDEDGKSSSRSSSDRSTKKGAKPYKCEVCGKSFTVERRLQNHKLSHNAERSSQCEKCGKRFARKDKLMRHMFVHSEEKLFSCDICQKRFSRRDKLSDHLKSHGGVDEIHNCPMCEKQFLRPDILKQHVKLHRMGNKHQCSECLRFVTGKDRLDKHMARHKEAKALGQTLLCPLCTKYFIQKQSLKAHIKKFHPNSNINIDAQDSELDQQQHLLGQPSSNSLAETESLQTLQSQDDDEDVKRKQFPCDHCPKTFAKKQALKKHLRKHQSSSSPLRSSSPGSILPDSSPSPPVEELMVIPTSNSPAHILSTSISNSSAAPSHIIIPTATPPNVVDPTSSSPNSLTMNAATHDIIQQTINSAQCSHVLQHTAHTHSPLNPHHSSHNQLLAHGAHTAHAAQVTALTHPAGQLHPNLSQHVSVPTIQHHVSMATQQSMCGSSYVLAYPHYSYQ